MKTNSEHLDEMLQKEMANLRQLLEGCLETQDYLNAHFYQQNIFELSQLINAVKNTKGSIRKKKSRLISQIKLLSRNIDKYPNYNDALLRKIEKYKEELKALELQEQKPFEDSSVILDALYDLMENKLSIINIHYDVEENIYLTIKKVEEKNIELIFNHSPKEKNRYKGFNPKKLKNIGFNIDGETKNMFVKNIRKQKLNQVIEIIARISFEAFMEVKDDVKIEIKR